jgi:hypothetical protein
VANPPTNQSLSAKKTGDGNDIQEQGFYRIAGYCACCGSADAAAVKKISYEEAYKRCKAFLDKEGGPGTGTQANVRYTRGAPA